MRLLKKIKIAETTVSTDHKSPNGEHVQTGYITVKCPYCGKYSRITYFDKDGDINMYQKYCPYCGRKLVIEEKK